MRIIGIDPGLSLTGYGVIERVASPPTLLEAGVLKSSPDQPLDTRLRDLHQGLVEVIRLTRPEMMAVESLFSNYRHPNSAIQMAHARGVLLLAASLMNLPVYDYPPARVKKALTGSGRATKRQMQSMIQSIFSLDEPPEPPDVADALAVALCHSESIRQGSASPRKRRGKLPGPIADAIAKSGAERSDTRSFETLVGDLTKRK